MRRALLSLLALFGCRDPAIQIAFEAAPPYREDLETILVQVIDPPRDDHPSLVAFWRRS